MSDDVVRALQHDLALKHRELDLIRAIDRIRDTAPDPAAMLNAIVELLAERLGAELCLMVLLDREEGGVALRAVHAKGEFGPLIERIMADGLAQRACGLSQIAIWALREALASERLSEAALALEMAAVPIIMGHDDRLGAVLVARARPPFGAEDVQLLKTAEDQITRP